MRIVIVLCLLVTVVYGGKKPAIDQYAIFANDPDLKIVDTDDDNKPPTTFTGNVQQAKITSMENNNSGKGRFKYTFETQNGISIAQVGKLKDEKTFVVSGSYSYTGADGKRYKVKYTADEFGYHPITELDDSDEVQISPLPPAKPPTSGLQNNFGVNLNNRLSSNGLGIGGNGNGNGNINGRLSTNGLGNGGHSNGRLTSSGLGSDRPEGFKNPNNNNLLNNNNLNNNRNIISNINDLPFTNLVGSQFPNVAPQPFGNGRGYLPPKDYLPPKGYLPPQRN